MNKEILKNILVEKGIYKKETAGGRNFQCRCPICGDHPDDRKANHLYVATDKNMFHCFLNGCSGQTTRLLKQLGSISKIKEIFTKEELKVRPTHAAGIVKKKDLARKLKKFELPEITPGEYLAKRNYLKGRTDFQVEPENIPGLVLDIQGFVRENNIQVDSSLFDVNFIHENFIGILLQHQTILMCRCINPNIPMKFVKLPLQEDVLELSDYYMLYGNNKDSNKIVLAEGNFSLLGEYYYNTLGLKDSVNMYVATQSFDSAPSVLKSLCMDFQIFNFEVMFLSDADKQIYHYIKFLDRTEHVLKSLNIYYNKGKSDFGKFPIVPFKGGEMRDVKTRRKNKKTFQRNPY